MIIFMCVEEHKHSLGLHVHVSVTSPVYFSCSEGIKYELPMQSSVKVSTTKNILSGLLLRRHIAQLTTFAVNPGILLVYL